MATSVRITLPDVLREHQRDMERALATPLLRTWDDDVKFAGAAQPEAIGAVLVDAIHHDLRNARIGYLFRQKIATRGMSVWAQASKVSGKLAFYSELDLLVEVNWLRWCILQPAQRIALIDHELLHFAHSADEKGEHVYTMLGHDIEEFTAIARRWGAWRPALKAFAKGLDVGQQLGLFEDLQEYDTAADD